jgi:RND family efflux transporter MFP subunit
MTSQDLSDLRIDKSTFTAPGRRRRKSLWYIGGGVAFFIVVAAIIRIFFAGAVEVETTTVSMIYPTQAFTQLNASGYVVAQRKAAVAAKVTGNLEWIGVEEGSRVAAGQVIARLENRDAQAAKAQAVSRLESTRAELEQARAELNDATLAFNRQKVLLKDGIVSQADFDSADARYRRAKAGVAAAQSGIETAQAAVQAAAVNLDYTFIRAPFDAVVLTKNADVGDIVTPIGAAANAKAAVVTIADMRSLLVEVDVSESNLTKVTVGQPCEIQLDALQDIRFRGVVHMIVPTADRSKATVLVKVRFLDNDARILPEMSAKVAFLAHEAAAGDLKPKVGIPRTVVIDKAGRKVVYLVKDGKAVEVTITTGASLGDMVEVATGLKGGEKLVARPLDKIRAGMKVKTNEK